MSPDLARRDAADSRGPRGSQQRFSPATLSAAVDWKRRPRARAPAPPRKRRRRVRRRGALPHRLAHGGELAERALLDLAYALVAEPEPLADLAQRLGVLAREAVAGA